jgi:hypothetical protein
MFTTNFWRHVHKKLGFIKQEIRNLNNRTFSFGLCVCVRSCVVTIDIGFAELMRVPAVVHFKVKTPAICPHYTGLLISP